VKHQRPAASWLPLAQVCFWPYTFNSHYDARMHQRGHVLESLIRNGSHLRIPEDTHPCAN
jgi:hypothetical protein